ncbi:ParB N-terminal domain-containing protein [Microvirga makkahensis]|uniref:ParB N-terminal domain-containing protein n=1 Tax=Microvirga makkahensis TaxID=1128670 RepID=A0A7X3MUR3_9HYPH|nr:ParB N-terminal domain-containing protein [Microvirga makkahensis]MXQ13567.1 ParB N-terminal domain-containing protein [Microvirga makkahensis]
MRQISTEGLEKPANVNAGAVPMLQWLRIEDLLVDPAYQRPIVGQGRRNVMRIAKAFSWSCFSPVVVSPVEGGKFVIIDGQHRTTAAALIGFDSVPCQVVIASREQQAAAFKAINGITVPISPMALHAAAVVAREPWAIDTADICLRAEVELLRYPLPVERQRAGQTMAVGAITQCLKRFGPDTLITALQCVTQTVNNIPGALTSRMIRALCEVLHSNPYWRESGLALLEAFDTIELAAIQTRAAMYAGTMRISQVDSIRDQIRAELNRLLPTPEVEISMHSPPGSTRQMSALSERH